MLKIDVEGAEVDLLEALLSRPGLLERIDYIFVETHEKQIPALASRIAALRQRARHIERPVIDFHWN